MTRVEKAAEAARLRNQGLYAREIAERMGVATSTVSSWLCDPDGSQLKARKDGYRGICEECGGQTDGSEGAAKAPTRCMDCIRWTREEILTVFREWADEHGRSPLSKSAAPTGLPPERTVARLFGSWNAALLAVGLRLNCDRRPETQEAIEQAIRDGESVASIGARFDLSPETIYARFHYRGTSVTELRQRAAA